MWVNQELGEIANDPPNLDELIENIKRVKKKTQMMEKRGDEEKQNARKKLLYRNLPTDEVEAMPETETMTAPATKQAASGAKNIKSQQRQGPDLLQQSKQAEKESPKKKKNPGTPVSHMKQPVTISPRILEGGGQTTDPKVKKAMLGDSIGSIDFKMGEIGEHYDDDIYKYTKSTLKKGEDPAATSIKRNIESPKDSFEREDVNPNEMPILEMDLNLGDNSFEDMIAPNLTTPSGKKEPHKPQAGRAANPLREAGSKKIVGKRGDEDERKDYQMVDSNVLEKMISDINNMQMKVSNIEQENAVLKRKNIELVSDQKKFKAQTATDIQSTKKELKDVLNEKEARIGDIVKEEIKKNSEAPAEDTQMINLNILKDVQGMKQLLEQSLLRNNQITANETNPSRADVQGGLQLAESQAFSPPGNENTSQNPYNIHQSFGADNLRPVGSSAPYFGSTVGNANPSKVKQQQSYQDNPSSVYPGNPSQLHFPSSILRPNNPIYQGMNVASQMGIPNQQLHGINQNGSSTGSSVSPNSNALTSKWLTSLVTQKALLSSLRTKLHSLKDGLGNKKRSLRTYEKDVGLELSSLGLSFSHPLVHKLRRNVLKQAKEIRKIQIRFDQEKEKYKMRKKGVELLEKSLVYVQGAGNLSREADRHLDEILSGFKGIEHFPKDDVEPSVDDSLDTRNSLSNVEEDSLEMESRGELMHPGLTGVGLSGKAELLPTKDKTVLEKKSEPTIVLNSGEQSGQSGQNPYTSPEAQLPEGQPSSLETNNDQHISQPQPDGSLINQHLSPKVLHSQQQTLPIPQTFTQTIEIGAQDPRDPQAQQSRSVPLKRTVPNAAQAISAAAYYFGSQPTESATMRAVNNGQSPMRSSTPEYGLYFPTAENRRIRDSLGYLQSRVIDETESSAQMKRYFQSQAKWYSDMRGEVRHLLSRYGPQPYSGVY